MNGTSTTLQAKKLDSLNHFAADAGEDDFKWNMKDFIEVIRHYVRSPVFAGLFTVRTAIALGQVCRSFRTLFDGEFVKMVICLGNLDESLRFRFWYLKASWDE